MHDEATICGCCGTPDCCTLPPEFVRVRYYFGQRMGVMELSDEAAYHAGKHAFHNARLHGAGVLCGLRAERFAAVAGAQTTILRVIRGAAIDACGREIIVGVDQCIDVAAWFAKNKSRPELSGWTAGATPTLTVCLRYRECPSDPSPAPRDPCACDTGGCEYGRVREGFELTLLTDSEKDKCLDVSFPATAALIDAMEKSGGGDDSGLVREIDTLVAADCPKPAEGACLCLASFTVTLDATPVPIDISDPDNTIPERKSLLSTSALQSMLFELSSAGMDAGLVGPGPSIGPMSYTPTGSNVGSLFLPVTLAQGGSPPAPVPLVPATFDPARVKVKRLDLPGGWVDIAPLNAVYQPGPPSQFQIDLPAGLVTGNRYRLGIDPAFETPIVDELARSLQPRHFARLFAFVPDGPNLKLDPAV
jgi:hypothetical protein